MSGSATAYGFIGLGDMGGPMASNIAAGGHRLTVFDRAGTAERAPAGTDVADSTEAVAAAATTVFVSVPDGSDSMAVARAIAAAPGRATDVVIDLSTTGIAASREVGALCRDQGITYVDAPVSGGAAGARAGTITVIWSGPAALLEAHRDALNAMSGNVFQVGAEPGRAQAMKLANNFLSATAMAATGEAVLFGLSQGLDFATMLDVLNVSSGRNTATSDKYPARVLSETWDAGFRSRLMAKDTSLYLGSAREAGTPTRVAAVVDALWQEVERTLPDSDISEIFKVLRDG